MYILYYFVRQSKIEAKIKNEKHEKQIPPKKYLKNRFLRKIAASEFEAIIQIY